MYIVKQIHNHSCTSAKIYSQSRVKHFCLTLWLTHMLSELLLHKLYILHHNPTESAHTSLGAGLNNKCTFNDGLTTDVHNVSSLLRASRLSHAHPRDHNRSAYNMQHILQCVSVCVSVSVCVYVFNVDISRTHILQSIICVSCRCGRCVGDFDCVCVCDVRL